MQFRDFQSGIVPEENDRVLFRHKNVEGAAWPRDVTAGYHHKLAIEAGSGIDGIAETYKAGIVQSGPLVETRIFIDLTGLNSSAAGDIIGDDAAANCHIGQITVARNGTMIGGKVECLETPAGGEPDIDLYSAAEATGTEDAAITGLTETALLNAGADWTAGTSMGLTALPADEEYLYLVASGGGTDDAYTAGKFLITLYGYSA